MTQSEETDAARTESAYVPDPRRWRVLAVSLVVGFMSLLDVTIVNVALPSMRSGLDTSTGTIQWVVSGYALAFGTMAVLQALVATGFAVWVCGLDIAGPLWLLVVVAVADAVLGTALGLLASGFARTEFQAVQFMPAFILPQFLLCGLLVPRELLPPVLEWVSNLLPLSYAVDAMKDVTVQSEPLGDVLPSLGFIGLWIVLSLALGSLTLRRRTP